MTPKNPKSVPKIMNKIALPARWESAPKKTKTKEEALRRRRGQAKCDFVIEYDDSEFNNEDEDLMHSNTEDLSRNMPGFTGTDHLRPSPYPSVQHRKHPMHQPRNLR